MLRVRVRQHGGSTVRRTCIIEGVYYDKVGLLGKHTNSNTSLECRDIWFFTIKIIHEDFLVLLYSKLNKLFSVSK